MDFFFLIWTPCMHNCVPYRTVFKIGTTLCVEHGPLNWWFYGIVQYIGHRLCLHYGTIFQIWDPSLYTRGNERLEKVVHIKQVKYVLVVPTYCVGEIVLIWDHQFILVHFCFFWTMPLQLTWYMYLRIYVGDISCTLIFIFHGSSP